MAGHIYALVWHLVLEIYKFICDFEDCKNDWYSHIIKKITVTLCFSSRIIIVAFMKIFFLFQ